MVNKLLIAFDKGVKKLDKIANFCKAIPGKCLIGFFIFSVCCVIVAFWGKDALENIKILNTAYYDTLVAWVPSLVDFLAGLKGRAISIFSLIVTTLILLLHYLYRQPALLIAHSTMGHNLSEFDDNLKNLFWFKQTRVGLELPAQNASEKEVVSAIRSQDEALRSIQQTNWRSNVFYYGVAHTPLIFRLGYQFGQTKRVRFLHRFRPTEDAQTFKEMPTTDIDKAAWVRINGQFNIRNTDLLVAIATTYPITEQTLRLINIDNTMDVYNIEMDERTRGYDFFSSYNKIRGYADRIAEDIRMFVNQHGYQAIHMVISSSVPFAFYLAQQMNTNQYPKITVYHFDHGKYTWGVIIQEKVPENAIVWAKDYSAS